MTVADIGAGEGYYTVRLAERVGKDGRVLAQDIVPEVRDTLGERVERERLDNVSSSSASPTIRKLPDNSFDRVFMVHMYHEIERPYAFLWRLRPALAPGGRGIVVDADRPTDQHGTPPELLHCEFAAVGFRLVDRKPMPEVDGYVAIYGAVGARPEPKAIVPGTGLVEGEDAVAHRSGAIGQDQPGEAQREDPVSRPSARHEAQIGGIGQQPDEKAPRADRPCPAHLPADIPSERRAKPAANAIAS